jgi:DNA-binding XRE family transcriptional regulator
MTDFVDILVARISADPDLTEAGLATAAGLNNSTIRQMIKHHRNPRVDTAMKICRALGTTIEEFMGEARSSEERAILRLISQLPDPQLRQFLGYGEALAAQSQSALPKVPSKP